MNEDILSGLLLSLLSTNSYFKTCFLSDEVFLQAKEGTFQPPSCLRPKGSRPGVGCRGMSWDKNRLPAPVPVLRYA